jgi:hypothetical protein
MAIRSKKQALYFVKMVEEVAKERKLDALLKDLAPLRKELEAETLLEES